MKMSNTLNENNPQVCPGENAPEEIIVTKKDIDRAWFRWVTRSQAGWNYETMQGLGYCCTMLPFLKKIYKDPKELQEMVRLQSQYYNTNVTTGGFVIGADMAVEAEQGYKAKDLIPGLKTGLMGPLAGVGDTFFSVTINTILGSIATYMALNGNPIGVIIWLLASCVKLGFSRWFTHLAYKEGRKAVSAVSGTLKKITDAATILGVTVVGALIPSVVKASVTLQPTIGENVINIQEQMFDPMMPYIVPVLITVFIYWLLGRKNMNSTRVIFIAIILCVVTKALGILG